MFILQTAVLLENGTALAACPCPKVKIAPCAPQHPQKEGSCKLPFILFRKNVLGKFTLPRRMLIYRTGNAVKIRLFANVANQAFRVSRPCYKTWPLNFINRKFSVLPLNGSEHLIKTSPWSKMVLCTDTHIFFQIHSQTWLQFCTWSLLVSTVMKVSETSLSQQIWRNNTWHKESSD